jgi:hypothetical protein
VAALLDLPISPDDNVEESTALQHYGLSDMAGQLRVALDRFSGLRPVPFSIVVLLIVGYILLIGPGDYFLLSKVIRRMEWTWLTFPALVVAVSVGAYFLAYALKGDEVRLNQVDLVDVDVEGGWVRGTSWANIFSPRMETYDLTFRPLVPRGQPADRYDCLISWLGQPGGSLRGMESRTSGLSLWRRGYTFSPRLDALHGMPIPVWSTKSVTSRWSTPASDSVEADLAADGEMLGGTLRNAMDFPLEDSMLLFGHWAYELGTVAPGDAVEIDPMVERRSELKTWLTGQKLVIDKDSKSHLEAPSYDQTSVEIPEVLRVMMFFKAAGGRRYTGLLNRYQPFVDLSGLLKADRAILVARAPSQPGPSAGRGAELLRDDQPMGGPQDRHLTFYRFVLPVEMNGER